MKKMELKVNIAYNQVIELISQLPQSELEKLAKAIQVALKSKKKKKPPSPFQELLLKAPTWSDKEYQDYLDAKNHFNQFRAA